MKNLLIWSLIFFAIMATFVTSALSQTCGAGARFDPNTGQSCAQVVIVAPVTVTGTAVVPVTTVTQKTVPQYKAVVRKDKCSGKCTVRYVKWGTKTVPVTVTENETVPVTFSYTPIPGPQGPQGPQGPPGRSCTIISQNGMNILMCDDGTYAVLNQPPVQVQTVAVEKKEKKPGRSIGWRILEDALFFGGGMLAGRVTKKVPNLNIGRNGAITGGSWSPTTGRWQ